MSHSETLGQLVNETERTNPPVSRRQFLRTGAAAACLPAPVFAANAPAAETSRSAPRLFVGCCAYSYRKYLEKGQMTMEDFILKAVELGIPGVDMTTYYFKSTEPSYLTSLRYLAFKNCVAFSGAAIAVFMCQRDPADRAKQVEEIKKWVDVTEWLGASHLRVSAGKIPPGATLDQCIKWTAETMKRACDYSAQKGVTLGIENHDHGRVEEKASTLIEIIRRVDSPYAGINVDITNFTEDQYAQIEACVPYATHVHVRDEFYTQNNAPVDLDRVYRTFAQGGYRGYMSIEYSNEKTEGDPMTAIPKLVEKTKLLCKKYSSV